jgi:hypothetical protein
MRFGRRSGLPLLTSECLLRSFRVVSARQLLPEFGFPNNHNAVTMKNTLAALNCLNSSAAKVKATAVRMDTPKPSTSQLNTASTKKEDLADIALMANQSAIRGHSVSPVAAAQLTADVFNFRVRPMLFFITNNQ